MTPEALLYPIVIPFVAGLIAFLIPKRLAVLTKIIALVAVVATFYYAVELYAAQPLTYNWEPATQHFLLRLDGLGALILLGVGFFSLCILLYSLGFMRDEDVPVGAYHGNFLWCVSAACGTALAGNLLLLTAFWGFLGIPFFLLINMGAEESDVAAKKTLIILGGTDSLLILGIGIVWALSGTFQMGGEGISTASGAAALACLCFVAAAFAKAGGMPFHTWIPDAAETAPVPIVALLPASVDKLLGIYLLARVCLEMFVLTPAVRGIVMALGAITIIGAVMMALVQHNLRRLLGFHAVSQVGYMVLGVASGTVVGIVGGLFHMLNNAIYKACLFLTAGAAERRTGQRELSEMGGLAKAMPLTFAAAVVSALAISGVPPFNGFASKWMVYQGLIESGADGGYLWAIALVAAMFGSALTLASFVKVLHSVFLGQPSRAAAESRGPAPGILMKVPICVLAILCAILGVGALSIGVSKLVLPALPASLAADSFDAMTVGVWRPGLATVLLLLALLIGLAIYCAGTVRRMREDEAYVGGEAGERIADYRFDGTEFYRTVAKMAPLRELYRNAEQKWYDLYDIGRRTAFYVSDGLKALHSGMLLTYVSWCVLGLVVLLWFFMEIG